MKKLLLKNGFITDSKNDIEGNFDVLIENGIIADVSGNIECQDADVLDCSELLIIPGICDMHVHFRDPGQTHKEDIISGSEAAAAGGVTTVLCMPNTNPVVDNPEIVKYILNKAKDAKIKVHASCSLTKGLKGKELCDFKALFEAGAIAATDDGRPVENAYMMYKAMEQAHYAGLRVISHCEDLSLTNGGIINEGKVSKHLGVKGICKSSENTITARDINIALAKQLPIHIAHVSTTEAVKMLRYNTGFGVMVTSETAPHYFTLTEDKLYNKDADYRMSPPLRRQRDVNSIISAICDGTIDCIITDHAPHTEEEKKDFLNAPNGVIGLETSVAVTLTALYHTGLVSLKRIVQMMCVNTRRLLGLPGGGLSAGEIADIAIIDPNKEWVVNPRNFYSKSKNSCFKGMTLKGRVKYTIVDGKVVYTDKE